MKPPTEPHKPVQCDSRMLRLTFPLNKHLNIKQSLNYKLNINKTPKSKQNDVKKVKTSPQHRKLRIQYEQRQRQKLVITHL